MMTVGMIGLWFSLLSVSLITNFQYVVWLMLGGLAAHIAANCREPERARATPQREGVLVIQGRERTRVAPQRSVA